MFSHVVLFICTETIHSSNLLLLFQPARPLPQTIEFPSVFVCLSVAPSSPPSSRTRQTPLFPTPKTSSTTSQKLANPSTPHNTPHPSTSFKHSSKKRVNTLFKPPQTQSSESVLLLEPGPRASAMSCERYTLTLMCRSNPVLGSTEGEVILEQKAFKKAS